MKKPGCTLDFTHQRDKELFSAYQRIIKESSYINIFVVSRQLVSTPCSRFWVSPERAASVVSAMLGNRICLNLMRLTKQAMFREIARRVVAMCAVHRDLTFTEAVRRVVYSPAPQFYMTPRTAMEAIYKYKKWLYEKRN